ncbi:NrdJb [Silanimonas lenta]|uniref:TSCPD domain-containing protein n=1 Tax=Silanimonas lenta TaxID=265429 RepID=UPI00041E5675|nr:NrdJb [Silanimonas lenta]
MAIKITKKIKAYSVATPEDAAKAASPVPAATPAPAPSAEIIQMHEKLERPEVLVGATYKIKSPLFEHALYVTINDIVLNPGTEHELRRPFELFINSKNMEHFQWIVAITRIVSAVFRKGGDVTFLAEEMKAVFDPRGGYFKAGGVYMPSIIAEIGSVIEEHMKSIGLIKDPAISDEQRALIAEKRAVYEQGLRKGEGAAGSDIAVTGEGTSFPPSATLCAKCNTKALVLMDGCQTCLNCGYSKCG